LERAGADNIHIAYGLGPDRNTTAIETGTFNVYLHSIEKEMIYEVSMYMNISPNNIHFTERNRIFNYILFNLLFVFIRP